MPTLYDITIGADPVPPGGDPFDLALTPDTTTYIANPGMGWQEKNVNVRADTPDETVAYVRSNSPGPFFWSLINTDPGVYDWSAIDNFLANRAAEGKQGNFRLVSMQGEGHGTHRIPQWVIDLDAGVLGGPGAAGVDYLAGEPNYENVTYQTKWADFVEAARARYDGDDRIAAVDISGYGNFGEWTYLDDGRHAYDASPSTPTNLQSHARRMLTHLYVGGTVTDHQRRTAGNAGTETGVSYSYPGWTQTQLLMPNAGIRHHSAWVARDFPHVGHRRDVVGETTDPVVFWNGGGSTELGGEFDAGATAWTYMAPLWPTVPMCGELAQMTSTDPLVPTLLANTEAIGANSHMTWVHDNFTDDENPRPAGIADALLRWGYRFVLVSAATAVGAVARGAAFTPSFVVRNDGVAPNYPTVNGALEVRVGLRDGGGTVVHEWTLAEDTATWLPNDPVTATGPEHAVAEALTVPGSGVPAGSYTLTFGVYEPRTSSFVNLAVAEAPPADGRLDLGTITVT